MESEIIETDVAVVGGGMAGLTAAAYVARAGAQVTVLEQAAAIGGRARSGNRSGYLLNRGLHGFYLGGAASQVLDELQIVYPGRSPGPASVLEHGHLYPLPGNPMSMLRTPLLGVRDKLALVRLFARVPRIDAGQLSHQSIENWLQHSLRPEGARRLVRAIARTLSYSDSLDLASAELLIDRLQAFLKGGVRYIDGGWQTLVDGARRAAEGAGAQIVGAARVEAVEHQNGRVLAVRLVDGRMLHVSAAILATEPGDAARLLDGEPGRSLRRAISRTLPAEVACLDIGLSRLPAPRHAVVQDLAAPRFLSVQSLFARIAPEGGAVIHAAKQLRAEGLTDPEQDVRELEDFLDQVQPGWRTLVVERVFLPKMQAASSLPAAAAGGYAGRPSQRAPGLSNLYLAGDWVGPKGYLLDTSLASARASARLALAAIDSAQGTSRATPRAAARPLAATAHGTGAAR